MISCVITLVLLLGKGWCDFFWGAPTRYMYGSGLKHYLHYTKIHLAQGKSGCCLNIMMHLFPFT